MFYEIPDKLKLNLVVVFITSIAAFVLCQCNVIETGAYLTMQIPLLGFCIGVIFGMGMERYFWILACALFGELHVCKTLGATKSRFCDVKGRQHYNSLVVWLEGNEMHHMIADVDRDKANPMRANAFVKVKVLSGHALALRRESITIDEVGADYLFKLDKAIAEIPEMKFD